MTSERLFLPVAGAGRNWLPVAVFAAYIGAIVGVQLWFALDMDHFHEEMRALFRYHPFGDPALFADDYITSFINVFSHPYLYDGITRLWLWAGGSLTALHRGFIVVAWLALLLGMALAGRRLGDRVTALGVVGLVAAQPLYLYQVTSAVPHAFGFPLMIWAVLALLHGSARGLLAVTLLSGLLYPAVTPLTGLLLAWQLLVMDNVLRQPNRLRLKRLLLLAVTGALSLWLVFGSLASPTEDFGVPLVPLQQVETYPENGPEGRHFYGVTNPLLYVAGKAIGQFRSAEVLPALALLLLGGALAVYGFLGLARGSTARRGLAGFLLCSVAIAVAVYLLRPYQSYRFVLYPLFTFLPLFTVLGLQRLCRRLQPVLRRPEAAALAGLALLVLAFDSFDAAKAGHRYRLDSAGRQVMAFAAAQPPDTLFAAWPSPASGLELIPYLAARPSFVVRKVHYPAYESYTLAMRARMNALIDAYLATGPEPLRELHCRWGVDYLVVDRRHFVADGEPLEYFAPFGARIERIRAAQAPDAFLLADPPAAALVLDSGRYRIVDLAALAGGCGGIGRAD